MDFHNSSGIRSPFSPRQRSNAGRRSMNTFKKTPGKFLPGQDEEKGEIIYKTPHFTMETFGTPLPVMVTEALSYASGVSGVSGVSVRMSECGWCWAVCGRRVLAWPQHGNATGGSTARELLLPQTDLAHKADLVLIYYDGDAQMPSCVGVSPEGAVRYWSSLAAVTAYVESTCELAGQECAVLTASLVLATTSASLVQLVTEETDGRPSVTCKTLRPPSGFLGGLGRRVSLLFFQPAQPSETRLIGVAEVSDAEGEPVVALVVAGPALQLWARGQSHHHDLRRVLPHTHPELGGVELSCADVRAGGAHSVLLLLAAVAPDHLIRYVIAEVDVSCVTEPRVSVPGAGTARPPRPPAPPPAPRLAPPPAAAIYTALGLSAQTSPSEKPEFVDVSADGDTILGAETCNGMTLVFTAKHGVCRIISNLQNRSVCETPLESPSPADMYDGNLSLYHIDPHEVSEVTTDAAGKLKTAFLFHLRREPGACRRLLDQLLPPGADAHLSRTVLDIAHEMLDDMPQGDPRWRESPSSLQTRVSLGSSGALHIDAQLRDKRHALALFVEFLRATGLWARAGADTHQRVLQLAERVAAAAALRSLQQTPPLSEYVSAAVRALAEAEAAPELAAGQLSHDDVCYRRVTHVLRLLPALSLSPAPHHALHIIASVLSEMKACRSEWETALGVRVTGADSERAALCDALVRMLRDKFLPALSRADGAGAGAAWEGAGAVASLVLPDVSPAQGRLIIQLFLAEGQKERALSLAEQARDLRLLVVMCVADHDYDRLLRYITAYSDQGMLSHVFEYLVSCPAESRPTLLRRLAERHASALAVWLRGPADREERELRLQLLALLSLQDRAPLAAADALADLAHMETENVERMRTAASLSRLCWLSSGAGPGAGPRGVNSRLTLAAHVEALPPPLRAKMEGFAHVEDIVQLYIDAECGEGGGECELSEYDYMKALELSALVPDPERRDDLRLRVWCASIRRDSWAGSEADPDNTFFRLLMLARELEVEAEMVPPLEDVVTAPELAELSDRARHLIRAGYPQPA